MVGWGQVTGVDNPPGFTLKSSQGLGSHLGAMACAGHLRRTQVQVGDTVPSQLSRLAHGVLLPASEPGLCGESQLEHPLDPRLSSPQAAVPRSRCFPHGPARCPAHAPRCLSMLMGRGGGRLSAHFPDEGTGSGRVPVASLQPPLARTGRA